MSRSALVALSAASLLTVALAVPAVAGTGGACSKGVGWDRVQILDAEDTFLLDNVTAYGSVQRALDDSFYDETFLEDGFRASDRNGNGWVCIKDVYEHSNAPSQSQGFYYYVSTTDDNVRS